MARIAPLSHFQNQMDSLRDAVSPSGKQSRAVHQPVCSTDLSNGMQAHQNAFARARAMPRAEFALVWRLAQSTTLH
jgi:hypothetical protein